MSKVLITGGAGFIGSHLAEELLQRGNKVHIIDDLSTGSVNNIAHLQSHPQYSNSFESVLNEPVLTELIEECDFVFHLAAAVGVFLVVQSPIHTIENTVKSTELVLKSARRCNRPVLITSTSEVYGKSQQLPFREDANLVIGPSTMSRWSYACSKLLDEFLALAYHREHGLPVVVARLFNTVGPRQSDRYGMVIPRFVSQALAGEPLTVFGNGLQTRCFTYVGDTVRALLGLMERLEVTSGQLFNIGNPSEITIEALAHLIINRTNSSSKLVYVSYEEAYAYGFEDMSRRAPDIAKITNLLDWQPQVKLEIILDEVIAHIAKQQLPTR